MVILVIIIRLTHANVWESMRKPCSCTQFIKSCIFFTTSHVRIRIRYYKSCGCVWMCNEIKGTYDKMVLTIVPSYKNITRLLPLALLLMLHSRNNTDGNKLMIFSSIALCYGDTCYYHTSNSCKCMGVNEEALQLHAVHKKLYFFYYKSRENPYRVPQVTCMHQNMHYHHT